MYPKTPGLLYAGTQQTVYVSKDGGAQWTKVADGLTHAVPAIVVVPGEHTPIVTFAAAGQIVRYPAGGSGDSVGFISNLLIIVIVGSAAWFVLARYRLIPSPRALLRRFTQRGA